MGIFSSECNRCGSKEHTTDHCPHGMFASECRSCGSKEHATNHCPHGIFASECRHCGSKDHATAQCPHGMFSDECRCCGSKEHSTKHCPHGLFSDKCNHCGSSEHATDHCPQALFPKQCQKCGSKDHESDECPHGIFSNQCENCGSREHATKQCPHGFFSIACAYCGSNEHLTQACPHSFFSNQCGHCGSSDHATKNCPHGLFSHQCDHCGSKEHNTKDCPHHFLGLGKIFSNKKSAKITREQDITEDKLQTIGSLPNNDPNYLDGKSKFLTGLIFIPFFLGGAWLVDNSADFSVLWWVGIVLAISTAMYAIRTMFIIFALVLCYQVLSFLLTDTSKVAKSNKQIQATQPNNTSNIEKQKVNSGAENIQLKTVKFSSTDGDGWAKKQDANLWVRPAPPYERPPITLEAKGQDLLYLGEKSIVKILKRLPVHEAPSTESPVNYYLEPGQNVQIVEGYEKIVRPAKVIFKKNWNLPSTNESYKADETLYAYLSEEGCFWLMYSAKTKGQFSDGFCPPEADDIATVDYGEGIYFDKIMPLAFSDKGSGWVNSADAHPLDGNAYEEVIGENQGAAPETGNSKTEVVDTGLNTSNSEDPQTNKMDVEHATVTLPNTADDSAIPLILGMLDQAVKDDANADGEILKLKQKISDLPKPAKGEKKSARAINEQALSLFNSGKVAESIGLFNQATQLDQSDPEILNNLGYALLRHGKLEEAKAALLKTLALAPGRSPAWQNIADIFTIQGDQAKGIVAYENVYRFSKNRVKTHKFMKKLNETDGSALKDARQKAMAWAEKTYIDENLLQAIQQP